MSKSKVTKKERLYARKVAKKSIITSSKREKLILKAYVDFANSLEKEFNKSDKNIISKQLKLIFEPVMQQQLFQTWKLNVFEFIDYFKETWDRKLNTEQISIISSKLLGKTLKKEVAKKVTNISNFTEKLLNNKISELSEQGLSARDIRKEIIKLTKGEIGTQRARLIAREETSQAISKVNSVTAKEAGLTKKKWLHVGGGKSNRPNHFQIDGVVVGINKKFNVPGYKTTPASKMDRPKDLTAPAGQVINCYCQVFYY